jgi:hypothetical protein
VKCTRTREGQLRKEGLVVRPIEWFPTDSVVGKVITVLLVLLLHETNAWRPLTYSSRCIIEHSKIVEDSAPECVLKADNEVSE